jgi:hypothetical protein
MLHARFEVRAMYDLAQKSEELRLALVQVVAHLCRRQTREAAAVAQGEGQLHYRSQLVEASCVVFPLNAVASNSLRASFSDQRLHMVSVLLSQAGQGALLPDMLHSQSQWFNGNQVWAALVVSSDWNHVR